MHQDRCKYHAKHPTHAFRHKHVKRIDEAGISETAVQQRIGHVKGSKITKVYNHADESLRIDAIKIYTDCKSAKGFK